MTTDLLINRRLIKELLCRITDPDENVRHEATEALALIASDADWRPAELIEDNGIITIVDLLNEKNPHIISSALVACHQLHQRSVRQYVFTTRQNSPQANPSNSLV